MTRRGYSILELMIALALLGLLLATSWSLLDTYRKAEQRSWDLVERSQAVRVSTSWLENDLLHLYVDATKEGTTATNTPNKLPGPTQASPARVSQQSDNAQATIGTPKIETMFAGTSQGFSAVIVPSINPAPYMERLLESGDENPNDLSSLSQLDSSMRLDLHEQETVRRPIALDSLEISYELSLTGEAIQNSRQSISVFDLVRRERVNQDQLVEERENSWQSVDEPMLTARDLYRQTDESTSVDALTIQENTIHGLADAAFWYYNGATWVQNWNSNDGKLPVAVGLVFDFAPRQGVQPIVELTESSDSPSDRTFSDSPGTADRIIQNEPILESTREGFEMLQKDVKLVFQTPKSSTTNPNIQSGQQPSSVRGLKP